MTATPTMSAAGTTVTEINDGIYRISTPLPPNPGLPGGFTFNQFLVVDDEPLLFHTGMRKLFPVVREAVRSVLGDESKLRWVAFSHVESDESGSLDDWLSVAPHAEPVCSVIAAMVQMNDLADRPPRPMAEGEELVLGTKKRMRWLDAPHIPHNWECGFMFESSTRTLLCGDLFTHAGDKLPAVTEQEVFSAAEVMRKAGASGFSSDRGSRKILEKLARTEPTLLAVMHGSSYRGDGAVLLRALADAMDSEN